LEVLGLAPHRPPAAGSPPPATLAASPEPEPAPRHNLPVQLTSFIGRERETAEIRQRLEAAHLLTLTGTGGCGKTRLALRVAEGLLERYPDGVWFVELAPLTNPDLVPQEVARAMGLVADPAQPILAGLVGYLRGKHLLLVLDNCEHLVEACSHLVDTLLRACPRVRILATSREILGVAGEDAWRVPSLEVPPAAGSPSPDQLSRYEAVELFATRARALDPNFVLTAQQAPAVIEIVRRLDGIPLAIELAAARVKVLSVERIAARLDDQFRLLTGGSRTALPRQQTLRALIDWSYNLLSEPERRLLRRLAVFVGGWTLEAAEAVC
jgi:predicted ATPase